jgi:hypothetical protein
MRVIQPRYWGQIEFALRQTYESLSSSKNRSRTLSKLISADNGMFGMFGIAAAAAAATETACGLHNAAKLWDVVSNTDEEALVTNEKPVKCP